MEYKIKISDEWLYGEYDRPHPDDNYISWIFHIPCLKSKHEGRVNWEFKVSIPHICYDCKTELPEKENKIARSIFMARIIDGLDI